MFCFMRWFTPIFASKTITMTTGMCLIAACFFYKKKYFWVSNFLWLILKLWISSDHGAKFRKLMNTINLSSIADPHVSWSPASALALTCIFLANTINWHSATSRWLQHNPASWNQKEILSLQGKNQYCNK